MACGICSSHAREHLSLAASQMESGNHSDASHYLGRAELHQSMAETHGADAHDINRNGTSQVFRDHRGRLF